MQFLRILFAAATAFALSGAPDDARAQARRPAPSAADQARAQSLLAEAQAAFQKGDYAAAETAGLRLLEQNIRAYGADHPNVATALNLLGAAYLRRGKFNEAEGQFRRMLTIYERRLGKDHEYTAAALNSLALVLEKLGDYAGAESLLRRAYKILENKLGKEHADTATTLSNLGRVLDSQGKFAGGDSAAGKAGSAAPAGRATASGSETAAEQLLARADAALRRGDYQVAETLHHQALGIHERTLGAEHPRTATSLSNLGNVLFLQGKYAEAERTHRRALEVREKVLGADHPDVATSLNNLANTLQEQGKDQRLTVSELRTRARTGSGPTAFTEVETLFRRALSIQESTLGREHPATANTLNNLGVLLALRGDFEQAEAMHRAALGTLEKVFGPQHPDTAAVLTSLSLALDRQGKIVDAEASYRRAIETSRRSGNPRNLLINASRLGFSLAKRGRYSDALPYYRESIDTLDQLYSQTRGYSEETRQSFLSQFSAIYRETIRLLLLLHKSKPDAGHDREALAIASRNQSRVFTEMMRQADVAKFSGEPAFVRLRESREALQGALAQARQGRATVPVSQANAAQRVAEFDRQIKSSGEELGRVEAQLWREYPRYMELTSPRPVTVEDLQHKLLKSGEVLISYVLLPRETVIFAVTREQFRIVVSNVRRSDIAERVLRIRRSIEKVAIGESVLFLRQIEPDALHTLYRDLLAPVASMIDGRSQVLVVADGPLNTIPFEFLVTHYDEPDRLRFEEGRRTSDGTAGKPFLGEYADLSFVGKNTRFAYLPSLSALASQRLYPKGGAAPRLQLLAFADPIFSPDERHAMSDSTQEALGRLNLVVGAAAGASRIPRLRETAEEAREIARVLGGDSALFIGEEAQERAAKTAQLRDARFVVFATHGFLGGEFVSSDVPTEEGEAPRVLAGSNAQPALALTLVGDLKGEDGLLTMKEVIEDLELNAELVALSACNTAGESEAANNGEGFAGLTRAFMYAGARGLLVSHWSVDSLSTQALMTETFRGIRAGTPAIAAINEARAKLLGATYASGPYHFSRAHPFFWAPFVYVGD